MYDAKGLVLMKKEDGMLTDELGSYEIQEGLEFVFKAYVELTTVKLFLTTNRDVDDEEYTNIFSEYNIDELENMGFEVEEIDEEYNPVWCIKIKFEKDHSVMADILNEITAFHKDEMERVYNAIKGL